MTLSLYLQCVAMFICGQLLQLFWLKIPSLKKRAKAANFKFSPSDYWKEEWYLIIGTEILGAMLIIGLDQFIHWKPEVLDYIKWFFGAIGAFGSSVVLSKLSSYEKKLTEVINIKTDHSDSVIDTDAKGKPVTMQTAAPGEKKPT